VFRLNRCDWQAPTCKYILSNARSRSPSDPSSWPQFSVIVCKQYNHLGTHTLKLVQTHSMTAPTAARRSLHWENHSSQFQRVDEPSQYATQPMINRAHTLAWICKRTSGSFVLYTTSKHFLPPERGFYSIYQIHLWRGISRIYVTGRPDCLGPFCQEVRNDVWKYLQAVIIGLYAVFEQELAHPDPVPNRHQYLVPRIVP